MYDFSSSARYSPKCPGLAVAPDKILVMAHCMPVPGLENYQVRYEAAEKQERMSGILKASLLESTGTQVSSENMYVLTLAEGKAQALETLFVRQSQIGERVFIVGMAPGMSVGYRGLMVSALEPELFIAEDCRVTVVDPYVGTDCFTANGTSGSPIFAESDDALLSLVAWGRTVEDTNGPLLFSLQNHLLALLKTNP